MIAMLSLGGCLTTIHFPPDLWDWETGDTGRRGRTLPDPAPEDTAAAPGPPSPVVTELAWGCDPEGTAWSWDLVTDGWTGRSHLDLFGEGAEESHELQLVESHPDGAWDALRVGPLVDGVPPETQAPNVDTRFDCAAPELVSFAVRIRDPAGVLTDCVVGGADPEAATAAVRRLDPEVGALGQCRVWSAPQ